MGGVWCSGTSRIDHFVWHVEFAANIQADLITSKNPDGTITINDLELAALGTHFLALSYSGTPLTNQHIASYCDNTSAVSWAARMRTSKSIPAARLLRYLGLLRLQH